jgi:hypothetical protein
MDNEAGTWTRKRPDFELLTNNEGRRGMAEITALLQFRVNA